MILAHNYQRPEVQDVADFVGDSLGLSRKAAATDAEVIVFCGVHFMAETAAILAPAKRVLLPDLRAGCSLAATITAEDLRAVEGASSPGYIAVGYVNTTAEVKAELDYCCTSGNVLDVIDAIPEEPGHPLLPRLLPRRARAAHAAAPAGSRCGWASATCTRTSTRIPWNASARAPEAEVLVHPECGCAGQLIYAMGQRRHPRRGGAHRLHRADGAAGEGAARRTSSSSPPRPGSCTACSSLRRRSSFFAADRAAVCAFMKTITLEATRDALKLDRFHVTVPHGDRRPGPGLRWTGWWRWGRGWRRSRGTEGLAAFGIGYRPSAVGNWRRGR